MGLSYSFNLIFPVDECDRAIQVLASQLCASDRERLLAALPWRPSRDRVLEWRGASIRERSGFSTLRGGEYEQNDSYCFSALLHVDQGVLDYERAQPIALAREGERAQFGCMWTSFCAGDTFFIISSTAATSGMSRLCESSPGAQAPWKAVAQMGTAIALFLDTEEASAWILLYPRRGMVVRPDDEQFEPLDHDTCRPPTDAFWRDALDKAGVIWPA